MLSRLTGTGAERRDIVPRWKGTTADVARIGQAVQEAAAATTLRIELIDHLGTSKFDDFSGFEQELSKREKIKTLTIVAAGPANLCKTAIVFDATGVHANEAVTVISSGVDQEAVDRAHSTALRMVSAGTRGAIVSRLGYDALVPQVELLQPGQKSRLYKSASWVTLAVVGAVIGVIVTAALS